MERTIAQQVEDRAKALLNSQEKMVEDDAFVKECLDNNERGDGALFAEINKGKFLYNVTPKDGEWYHWNGNIWDLDDGSRHIAAVDEVAIHYQTQADRLFSECENNGITDKKHAEGHKLTTATNFRDRAKRLRGKDGANKAVYWAPIVDRSMMCREADFDNHPWLLPVANGVINLKTGAIEQGHPGDLLTRQLAIAYDPTADYEPWQQVVNEICDNPEIAAFLKRSFGYAITGHANEQHIWIFTGPGRNGKGVLFSMLQSVLGPYYHEINRGMLLQQRNEPSPAATSEHKYSLLGKRIIVGAETNRGQRIDAAAIKSLTGEDLIVCRPLYKSEIIFNPTHTLFLHTNHIPAGLTRDFALRERLFKIEFPYMYVDDVAAAERKEPGKKGMFRKKDVNLKTKLRACLPGILRWLVEGCLEWQQFGLAPPPVITKNVDDLAAEENYVAAFYADCLEQVETNPPTRIGITSMYDAFRWWGSENLDTDYQLPHLKTITAALRDMGYTTERKGGRIYLLNHMIKYDVIGDINEFLERNKGYKAKNKSYDPT